ncbi:MAG TPA: hypothetical protein VFR07_01765 [Mycobacteriales bacterium]|jgi:hypothetical protein|nr:hypothetical protein [Mycobacteriales bacterium]
MTGPPPLPLVPGELRGYRQFLLLQDGLYPVVHWAAGRWEPGRQVARCSAGGDHDVPARDCACGFYGWYDPSGTTGSYGGATAVIAASGRIVLGDRGFRAGRARVEAVALPMLLRWQPRGAARARRLLAEVYPDVQVYRSPRAMLRHYPPDDVRGLGVGPVDRTPLRCRRAAHALWALFVLAGYGVLLLPRESVASAMATWWPLLVLGVLAWQAALVTLMVRSQPSGRLEIGGVGGGDRAGSDRAEPDSPADPDRRRPPPD